MTKKDDRLFQDRVDELLLLEERAERRAEKFIEITDDYQERSQKAFNEFLEKIGRVDVSFAKMNAASEDVRDYVAYSKKHALRTAQLFLGTVIVCTVFLVGTLGWSYRITNQLEQDKADLAELDLKLKHTPVIIPIKGKEYVRVVPHSETAFVYKDGRDFPGRYAEVWHVR